MRRWIKRSIAVLPGLAVLVAVAGWLASVIGERKMRRRVQLAVAPLALRSDSAGVERGHYLFLSRGCAECHGSSGAGRGFINDGKGMRVRAPNITSGPGSAVAAYTTDDWVRRVAHGVRPDGRPIQIMPSEEFNRFTDGDLTAVIAYTRQLPPAASQR